ncbi:MULTISPECIES: alcohol dehydrogenase catalytic domain-containing protein [Aeromonas]|jgi:NADPH:quinone reductase|uniref:Uncharacterized protein n=3 Tax=Aeromonas TaxID=642 RepID=A0A6S5CCE1_AERVE|nr:MULTISPECIES: alcohol dehydrogenase catalytic domain-containing protein [Aeromonas]MEA9427085.1 alcohol dehydrogenase catalytic domain-containing protein [Aeromonas caviae]MEA9434878.1 alcohol dehydrogenase catalytic domain-containing protein [Aeromonas caviae]BBG91602.1 hypothetical protein ACGSH8M1_p10570 [Aeromonas caviae]BBR11794.1 hypothetical protein WP3S18E02_34550 [Aeromonas caviae]BBR40838.1 hypothetical protein WP3W19E03_33630 [Aeromonas veronii]
MKAVGYKVPGPIAEDASLVDIDLPRPVAEGGDILVEVKAVSVNPVDYKIRSSTPPADGDWKVLGWDAAGIVQEVGPDVTQFAVGDEVYYAGSLIRPGTNAEFHLVDARIVGRKPASLDWAEAAALPLTTLTAWEAMFDRLDVTKPVPGARIGRINALFTQVQQLWTAVDSFDTPAMQPNPADGEPATLKIYPPLSH